MKATHHDQAHSTKSHKDEETMRKATSDEGKNAVQERSKTEAMRDQPRTGKLEVTVKDGKLSPDSLSSKVMETVEWYNQGKVDCAIEFAAALPGQVGCVPPPASPPIPPNGVYRYAFSVPGSYQYFLKDDPDCKGVITVS